MHANEQSIRRALLELERAFEAFSFSLFKQRKLPTPMITIQTRGRRANTHGWFLKDQWARGADKVPEINICAESLNQSTQEICHVLLRQMVHYANAAAGISDCPNGRYFNRKFRDRCQQIGLGCRKVPGRGWAKTFLTDELRQQIEDLRLDAGAFDMFRRGATQEKSETRQELWECGCTKIRAAVEVDATCNRCGRQFTIRPAAQTCRRSRETELSELPGQR